MKLGVLVFALCVAVGLSTGAVTPNTKILATSHLPHSSHERVTPDYVAGPWFPMEPEQDILPFTQRPRVVKALDLLREVVGAVNEATEQMVQARNKTIHTEQKVISEGKETVSSLSTEIDQINAVGESYSKIVPTQQEINMKINENLVELLQDKSQIHQIEADVRLPFADRLADYTSDLQKILRSKEEAECQMRDFLSPAELNALVGQFSELAKQVQDKIDAEVAAAGEILNPNAKRLEDNTQELNSTRRDLDRLRSNVVDYIEQSKDFVPRSAEMKGLTLTDTQHLVDAMTRVVAIQDDLVLKTKEAQEKQIGIVHHTATLLSSLLVEDSSPTQDATVPSLAMQRVEKN